MPLPLLFRDDSYVAVNKPAGLLVHRSEVDRHETRFALQLVRDQFGSRVYPVHRLDRPTSGVLLFGLSEEAARRMAAVFESDDAVKTYLAIVRGVSAAEAVIDYPLAPVPDRMLGTAAPGSGEAKHAVTCYRRLASVELPMAVGVHPTARYSLLEVTLRTGRRHQIRRHLKHVFHPIVGDTTYGDGRHNRLFRERFDCRRLLLHAVGLSFSHPWTGERIEIRAPLDEEFSAVVRRLGWADALAARWQGF